MYNVFACLELSVSCVCVCVRVCVCMCVCVQTSSSPGMDGVLEVLSKPPEDRTEEDIGE